MPALSCAAAHGVGAGFRSGRRPSSPRTRSPPLCPRSPAAKLAGGAGAVLIADRKTETESRARSSSVYQPSTGSRRSPRDSVHLHGHDAASERDGENRAVPDGCRSPHPSRFLNHVRRSDSCRGHSRAAGTTLDCRMLRPRSLSVPCVLFCASQPRLLCQRRPSDPRRH